MDNLQDKIMALDDLKKKLMEWGAEESDAKNAALMIIFGYESPTRLFPRETQ